MRKNNKLFMGLVGLLLLSSCADNREKELAYPVSPRDGQVYVDPYGNHSVWNAAMQYWMISSMINGQRVNHYYYPSTGIYRDQNMRAITRTQYTTTARKANPSRSFFGGSKSSAPSSGKSGGFGSTGRSSSSGSSAA